MTTSAESGALRSAPAGRYVFVREVGSGGMATVYLAEDVRHHRKVAVKVLRSDLAATPASHILPVLDSGDAGGGTPRLVLRQQGPDIGGKSLLDH